MMNLDLTSVTMAIFEPHAGSSFAVPGVPPLKLEAVRESGQARPGSRAPFALEFSAEHDGYLAQGTYILTHAALGELELFLVPLGPGANGLMRYEAVFG